MPLPLVETKNVIVTGCSSGIGEATARVLRDRGWRVIPTARKDEDLSSLEKEGFQPVRLDMADSDSVQLAAKTALELLDGRVGGLVNNAGIAQPGAIEDLSRDAMRYQFEVNVFGMQEFTNCLIPTFQSQGWGRIVNISSVVGRIALPMLGIYSATKYAMEAISDAMRIELRSQGIGVVLVEPGPIVSNFRKNASTIAEERLDTGTSRFGGLYEKEIARRKNQVKKPDFFRKPPEDVAKKVLHALESSKPKLRYCVTIPAYAVSFSRRFIPERLMDRIIGARMPG